MNGQPAILQVRDLTHLFGGLAALSDLTFSVPRGQIKGIIGPNGAGKTTLFNIIAGVFRPTRGSVLLKDEPIEHLLPHRRVSKGVARTFQNLQIFGELSVLENVMIGRHSRGRAGFLAAMVRSPASRREDALMREAAFEALETMGLAAYAARPASALSFGEAKILEIARALAAEPDLLLLDEPTAGLPHESVSEVADVIRRINDRGITVLLVEHNMKLVMSLCEDILVVNHGRAIAEGAPDQVKRAPEVLRAYLGEDAGHA